MRYRCICGYMYEETHCFQKHFSTNHGVKITTDEVRKKYSIKEQPKTEVHNEIIPRHLSRCTICGRHLFPSCLDDHIKMHAELKYKCEEEGCGWMYREDEYGQLVQHCRLKHGINIREKKEEDDIEKEIFRKCPICTRVMGGQKSLMTHINNHGKLKDICAENGCGWAYECFTLLHDHYSNHHELFMTKDHTGRIHVIGHVGTPFAMQCPICKRNFSNKPAKYFHQHVRSHDLLKYQCKEPDCGWVFETFKKLQCHKHYHHNTECSQAEIEEENLKNKKPLKGLCSTCGRKLQEKHYREHMAAHQSNEKMYRCPVSTCEFMYEKVNLFTSHCRLVHKIRLEGRSHERYLQRSFASVESQENPSETQLKVHKAEDTEITETASTTAASMDTQNIHDSFNLGMSSEHCPSAFSFGSSLENTPVSMWEYGMKSFNEEESGQSESLIGTNLLQTTASTQNSLEGNSSIVREEGMGGLYYSNTLYCIQNKKNYTP